MTSLPEGPPCHLLWSPGVILVSFCSNCNFLHPVLLLYQLCLHGFYQHSLSAVSSLPTPSLGSNLTHPFWPSSGTCFLRKPFLLLSLGQVYLLCSHSSCPASFEYHKAIVCSCLFHWVRSSGHVFTSSFKLRAISHGLDLWEWGGVNAGQGAGWVGAVLVECVEGNVWSFHVHGIMHLWARQLCRRDPYGSLWRRRAKGLNSYKQVSILISRSFFLTFLPLNATSMETYVQGSLTYSEASYQSEGGWADPDSQLGACGQQPESA